jgi:hypothetical protein
MNPDDFIKLQDTKSVLVVGQAGKLRQLHVPFRVQCIEPVERIPEHTWVYVERVLMHPRYLLLYGINQRFYPYRHFRIELLF